ncbi:hypothetical protein M0R01_03910 [bacterium]|nr:hypothetical protein [bacterium]
MKGKILAMFFILAICIGYIGCGHSLTGSDCERDRPDAPYGYYQYSEYKSGEYHSISYTDGHGSWITYTSSDKCNDYEESTYNTN